MDPLFLKGVMMLRHQDMGDDFIPIDTSSHETYNDNFENREERRLCILDYDARYDFVVAVEIPLPWDSYPCIHEKNRHSENYAKVNNTERYDRTNAFSFDR